MKRSWILAMGILTAVSLTACGAENGGADVKSETMAAASSDAETTEASTEEVSTAAEETTQQETETGEAVSEEVKRLLEGEILPVEQDSEWDLDRDGSAEKLQLKYDEYEFTLTAGAAEITQEAWDATGEMFVASLDGETLQVLVPEAGPSDDPQTYFFRYENGELKKIGSVYSAVEDMQIREKQLHCREISSIFQTVSVETAYQFSEGELKAVPLDFYEMGNTVTTEREVVTYAEKEGTENGPVIPADTEVVILGTDNHSWVKIQTSDGETGWLKVVEDSFYILEMNGEEIPATECFRNLILAG